MQWSNHHDFLQIIKVCPEEVIANEVVDDMDHDTQEGSIQM